MAIVKSLFKRLEGVSEVAVEHFMTAFKLKCRQCVEITLGKKGFSYVCFKKQNLLWIYTKAK